MAERISEAQRRILIEARDHRGVKGYMQRRRPCERLAQRGLLTRVSLEGYEITPAGRAALQAKEEGK